MPQQEMPRLEHAALASLRDEGRRLRQLVYSLDAQKGADPDWLLVAWRRLHRRAMAYTDREIAAFGSVRTETDFLVDEIEDALHRLDAHWVRDLDPATQRLILHRRAWGTGTDDDEDDQDTSEDPNAPTAPPPLVVIEPNSSPRNRYGGSRSVPGRDDFAVLEWAFGETDDDTGGWKAGVLLSGEQPGTVRRVRRTGRPLGRPKRGTGDAGTAERLILERVEGRPMELLRSCLGRGKTRTDALELRPVLAAALREISASGGASHRALAEALDCSVRTVDRLVA